MERYPNPKRLQYETFHRKLTNANEQSLIQKTMTNTTEATSSKKRRVKPSIWRRLFAWGPLGLIVLLWFHSLLFAMSLRLDGENKMRDWDCELISRSGALGFKYEGWEYDELTYRGVLADTEMDFRHVVNPMNDGISSIFPSHKWEKSSDNYGTYTVHTIVAHIPFWWLLVLSSLWVAMLVWWRKQRGATDCLNCGYDLRGSNGACPECGTIPKTGKASI